MSAPKSVMKIDKNGVHFTESVDRANYLITELTRAALKDVAKFVLRIVRQNLRDINDQVKKMRYAGLRYQYWVRKQESDLQLGIENTKYGAETAWWADQSELGTANQPKRGFLRNAVYDNISMIRQIEAQYLSAIEDDIAAEAMVDEEENDPGVEEE